MIKMLCIRMNSPSGGGRNRLASGVSTVIPGAKRQLNNGYKVLGERKYKPRVLYLAKLLLI